MAPKPGFDELFVDYMVTELGSLVDSIERGEELPIGIGQVADNLTEAIGARDFYDALLDIGVLIHVVTALEPIVVRGARDAGASWAEIGRRLGRTRSAVQQFYGRDEE
jgi:hypothetical protein